MSTATREPGTDSPVSGVLADIEKYGRQFIRERDVHAIFARSLDGYLVVSLNHGAAGNTVVCTARFFVEACGNRLLVRVVENYGTAEDHHPPGLTAETADETHSGLLSWLRLWAAAWLDQAHRS